MSLRTKLVLSFAAVILLALALSGAASIVLRRDEQRQASLDRLAAAAPQLTLDLLRLQRPGISAEQRSELVREEAERRKVRIMLVDRGGVVTLDSGGSLTGDRLEIPAGESATNGPRPRRLNYRTWEGTDGEQRGLVFLAAGVRPEPRGPFPRGGAAFEPNETVVVAVPQQTLARAWFGLLPGLTWAGLIALALSVVVAALLARSIARPVQALTRASEEMAQGNYDQAISLRRGDEIGRLASAFNQMARQVGRSHVQMRTLLANVTHDLKTPLTSILGFSQALRDGTVSSDDTAETAAIIHAEAERIQALVEDLLYLSEIDAGQVLLAREPVDLAALAGRCARRFEPGLRERGISLTFEGVAAPASLVVEGDSARIERILDNLLDNTRKYTPTGGTVAVRLRALPPPGPAVRVEVHNSGSPIAAEELPRLFDRFYRVERARGRSGGSGLGLAIARELAELHGGTLSVSADPTGTTFALTLPGR